MRGTRAGQITACGPEASSRGGVSIQGTGQEETQSFGEPSGLQATSRPAFPLLPDPSCGLTPVNSEQSICGVLLHTQASVEGFGV